MLRRSILGSEDPDDISLPEQMVLGVNQFAHLYDDVPLENNDDRNATSALGGAGTNEDLILGRSSHRNEYDKRLKDCFFPQKSSGGKLHIYANKPDGITKSLLIAKNMSNPVDVSVQTIMRAAKEVRNGRKALACVKEAESDYKDGTLPSGRTISDYHRYVRERMFVKLKGTIGADCDDADADDDVIGSEDVEKQQDDNGNRLINPEEMPEDYYFSGMIAFFLWGHIIEDPNQECYRSKQFQIGDSAPEEKGLQAGGR
ncbi:hypothetical protein MHU86_18261 [Fragilaria crotonensis]|nr:hypothetical protein MHU86_18261 [Fragilaria crotonensis]